MALKPDQRALLQLLCERGQSYADLAGLLDIPEDQVRERARAALTELGGSDPDAEVGLTDYLLGQADPIGRADAVRFLQQDGGARELAADIVVRLQAIAPDAELPKLPEARSKRRGSAAPAPSDSPKPEPADAPTPRKPAAKRPRPMPQSRLIAAIAGAGILLLFVILGVAGAFSGDDGSPGDAAEQTGDPAAELEGFEGSTTTIPLEPRGGSGVAGEASFGVSNDTLSVDLDVEGLDPEPPRGRVYVLWLMVAGEGGYPVQIIFPDENGRVRERLPIPGAVAVTVASAARFVEISESRAGPLQEVIDQAVESDSPLVPFSGESLARGEIPLAERGAQGGSGNGSEG